MLENLGSAVQVASGGNFTGDNVAAPELRALLERFVASNTDLSYATLLNSDAKGISAGKITPDVFLQTRTGACVRCRAGWPSLLRAASDDRRRKRQPYRRIWSVIH